jgi:PAS domain-containing protein
MGVVVLVGWIAGLAALTTVMPGLASMKPNTALGFLLAGAALALSARDGHPMRDRLRSGLAGLVALLGLLTVAEYLLGVDLGIDNLLLSVPPDPVAGNAPRGRMALATAMGFSCCGLALLLLDAHDRRGVFIGQGFAVAGGFIGLLAVFGYLVNVQALYSVFLFSSVAIHTAVGLLAIATGTLLARPGRGAMAAVSGPRLGSAVARGLLPYALLAPMLIAWAGHEAEARGWLHASMATALVNLAYMALFTLLVLRLSAVLNRVDSDRAAVHAAESKQRLQLDGIIKTAIDAVVVLDARQRIVVFNPAAEAMFLRKADEVLGHGLDLVLPPQVRQRHTQHVLDFGNSADSPGLAARPMGGSRGITGLRSTGEESRSKPRFRRSTSMASATSPRSCVT